MTRLKIIIAVATITVFTSGLCFPDSTGYELPNLTKKQLETIENYIQKGNYHAEKKAYRTALNEYNKAVELAPLLFNPRYNKSRMLYQLGDTDKAIKELNSLNKDFPENISGFNFLGQIVVEKGNKEEGIKLFEKAIKNGETILKKSQLEQAKVDIALAYHNLGSLQAEKGDLKSAEENFRKSINADNTNYFSYYALGALLVKMAKFNDAVVELQKARELNRDFIPIHTQLAKAYLFSNPQNTMRAISTLRDAARKEPNNPLIYELLGDAYIIRAKSNLELRLNDYKEAMDSYRTAMNIDKKNPRYKVMFARACTLAGEDDTALKTIKDIEKSGIQLSGKYLKELHIVKAHICRKEKDFVNAANEYSQAFELDEKDVAVALEAGINYYEAEDYVNSKKYLEKALEPFSGEVPEDLKPKIERARKILLEIENNQ